MKLSIETKIQSIGNLYENTNSHTYTPTHNANAQMVQELDLNQPTAIANQPPIRMKTNTKPPNRRGCNWRLKPPMAV